MTTMTMRERMLAVIRGGELDRVPFVQYTGLAAPDADVWALLGRNRMGILEWVGLTREASPGWEMKEELFQAGGEERRRVRLFSAKGELTATFRHPGNLPAWAFDKHFIESEADYRLFLAYLQDTHLVENFAAVQAVADRLGDDGLPHACMPRTPIQEMWAGPGWRSFEDLCLDFQDCPELLEDCLNELGRLWFEAADVACRGFKNGFRVPYVVRPDNATATIPGPPQFEKRILPFYREMTGRLGEFGIPAHAHLDGNFGGMEPLVTASGIRGIDSYSPPPDNDTSVERALSLWPEMRLLINFPSSVHLRTPEGVHAVAREILRQGGKSGQLWIQLSEDMPGGVWRQNLKAIDQAITEFGRVR